MSPPRDRPQLQWRSWRIVAVPLVTAAVVFVLVRHLAGTRAFVDTLHGVRWEMLPIPLGLVTLNIGVQVVRWRIVLGAMGHELPTRTGLFAVLATYPLAVLVPSRAGDLLRALVVRPKIPAFEAAGSVLAEKVIDVQTLCLLALTGTAVHGLWSWCALSAAALCGLWLGVIAMLRFEDRLVQLPGARRAADKIRKLLRAFRALIACPRALLLAAAVSLAAWLVVLVIIATLLEMTRADVSFLSVLSLWPIATFVGIVPVTTAGMGTRDAAFLFLLGAAGTSATGAPILVATLLYSIVTSWFYAIVGMPFLVRLLADSAPATTNK